MFTLSFVEFINDGEFEFISELVTVKSGDLDDFIEML